MPTITVNRKNKELTGKALSANTLASILVSQGVQSVADLDINRPMPSDLLLFLNRQRAIGYWLDQGWFRTEGGFLYLTENGLDEVQSREAGVACGADGRKKPGNVTPELIREARNFIENVQEGDDNQVLSARYKLSS